MGAGEVEAGLLLDHPGFGKLCALLKEAKSMQPPQGRPHKVKKFQN